MTRFQPNGVRIGYQPIRQATPGEQLIGLYGAWQSLGPETKARIKRALDLANNRELYQLERIDNLERLYGQLLKQPSSSNDIPASPDLSAITNTALQELDKLKSGDSDFDVDQATADYQQRQATIDKAKRDMEGYRPLREVNYAPRSTFKTFDDLQDYYVSPIQNWHDLRAKRQYNRVDVPNVNGTIRIDNQRQATIDKAKRDMEGYRPLRDMR